MCTQTLTDGQRRLVEDNIRLATFIAKRFTGVMAYTGLDFDDLFSLACLGLCRGAQLYDPAISKPSTYLCRCCETAILHELCKIRRRRGIAHVVSLDESIPWFPDAEVTLGDLLEDKATDVASDAVAHMALTHVLEEATERELTVLNLYASGMNQTEIAPIVGVAQTTVSRILAKVRRCANEVLAESDGRECHASGSAIDCRAESAG